MARFKADEANNYGGQGGGGFFSITNDKEVKQVRFMYDKVEDIEGMSVHKIQIGDKDRYVNCLRKYNQPVDDCPFCRENKERPGMYPVQAKLFIPVYNIDEDAVQVWDRGKTMFSKMTSLCSRYATKDNLVNNVFEIERNGKPKDTKTTYEIFQVDKDDTELADLPELPTILGGIVIDKTAEEMEYYIEEGSFPPTDDDEEEERPVRRRESKGRDTSRRTPATGNRRRTEDSF